MAVCNKCYTRYTATYRDSKCQRCKDEEENSKDIIDVATDIAVGYAIGSLISGIFDSGSSSSDSGSSSDWSGGGGEAGGGGASSDW